MVEFALPKNSRISGGKTWPKPAGATETREFNNYRWNPDDGKNPSVDTYYVDIQDCRPMVLDGLIWIKNHIHPTLTFRRTRRGGEDQSAAAAAGRQRPSSRPHQFLRPICFHRAVAEDDFADTAEGME